MSHLATINIRRCTQGFKWGYFTCGISQMIGVTKIVVKLWHDAPVPLTVTVTDRRGKVTETFTVPPGECPLCMRGEANS